MSVFQKRSLACRIAVGFTAVTIGVAALSLGAPAFARSKKAAAAAPAEKVLRYTGILQDEKRAPIGGIYQLEFSLYPSKASKSPMWSETHWVAVDNGHYVVALGSRTPIPDKANLDRAYIGVGVPGAGEILRERLLVAVDGQASPSDEEQPAPEPAKTKGANSGVVDYAEKAGFAYEAELATNANKLEGMTVEDLKRSLEKPPKIGAKSTDTAAAGGQGGYAFEHTCPKGYVVTGMKGAAGLYIDSLQLICSPLE